MKWYDRLLIVCNGLLLLTLSVLLGWLVIFWTEALTQLLQPFFPGNSLSLSRNAIWSGLVVAVLLCLFGLRLVVVPFLRKSEPRGIYQINETGHVEVALEALESIVRQAAGKVRGVQEMRLKLRPSEVGNVSIHLRLVVDGERNFPGLVEEVQQNVKNRVEEIAGVPVSEVGVVVAQISQPSMHRSTRIKLE